ncbi:MAG: NAD(P)/FAD-dependent oxidoreductase [Phycisphaerae bacterium]|nr:NAD(P)/FAD-dependent oxidoreductase [Phycisphaerae bacterium]
MNGLSIHRSWFRLHRFFFRLLSFQPLPAHNARVDSTANDRIVIIGAGPAGLTAAYELSRHGRTGIILESDNVVGGIARTVERDGYRFDIGGHRFFTKVQQIEKLWDEMLGEPMLDRPRMSRIYYGGKFYDYPLKATNALKNMGIFNAATCMMSYGMARLKPNPSPKNYEEWVTNQFGSKLFNMFFKSYTEKVWGIPCSQIGADWAAQRIKGLSLGEAVRNALFGQKKGGVVKTLINTFRYPRLGPGQLWEACAKTLQGWGWELRMQTRATGLALQNGRVTSVTATSKEGQSETIPASHVFSSMPLRTLLQIMEPPPPADVMTAANQLAYRDFLTVVLVIDKPEVFPDNWIYIHEPQVKMGRIQNFKSWSPEMVPDPSKACLGLEYFVNEGDELWSMADDKLIELGYRELMQIGLAGGAMVKGYVVRMPKAYPVYDTGYQQRLDTIRAFLMTIGNLYCVGRNGQHRYNNQDHSMATAIIAARNVALGETRDPWAVNEDAEYHEISKTERQAPITPRTGNDPVPPQRSGAQAVHEHAEPVPAVAVIGDPQAAATEHMALEGQRDAAIVIEDPPG